MPRNTASSVIDTILGEAVSGKPAERYRDMLAISSAILNRSTQLGMPAETIVAAPGQFNAYGRALPAGADRYRSLAQRAWDAVNKTGPVHAGTYYATPAAAKNLPDSLSPVASTTGHNFYTDPLGRPVATTKGYISPVSQVQPATAPGPGLEALAPHGLIGTGPLASYSRDGLTPGISNVLDALSRNPIGAAVSVKSGYRSPARNAAAGGAKRSQHLSGNAVDVDVRALSNEQKQSLLDTAIESGAKGIGIYSSGNTLHFDARKSPATWADNYRGLAPENQPAWAQDSLKGMFGAGQFAVTPRTTAPTPAARPSLERTMAAPTAGPVTRAPLGLPSLPSPAQSPLAGLPMASPPVASLMAAPMSSVAPMGSRVGALGKAAPKGNRVAPAMAAPAPERMASLSPPSMSISAPVSPVGGYAVAQAPDTMTAVGGVPSPARPDNVARPGPKGVFSVDPPASAISSLPTVTATVGAPPVSVPAPALTPRAVPASLAVPPAIAAPLNLPTVQPTRQPTRQPPAARQRQSAPAQAPTISAPRTTPADVYAGRAQEAVAADGNKVSRDQLGRISIDNKYGARTTRAPDGTTLGNMRSLGAMLGSAGLPDIDGKAVAGGLLGSLIGSAIAGPVGGIVGAQAGQRLATGQGILGGFLASYPERPAGPVGSVNGALGSGQIDHGLMDSLSSRERAGISGALNSGRMTGLW